MINGYNLSEFHVSFTGFMQIMVTTENFELKGNKNIHKYLRIKVYSLVQIDGLSISL